MLARHQRPTFNRGAAFMASRILFSSASRRAASSLSALTRGSGGSGGARFMSGCRAATTAAVITGGATAFAATSWAFAETPPSKSSSSPSTSDAAPSNEPLSKEEIAATAAAINDLLDNSEDDGLGPTLVRLAWHASGTYDKSSNSGGSDGATMRFSPESDYGANAGLNVARDALEPIKKLFPRIS